MQQVDRVPYVLSAIDEQEVKVYRSTGIETNFCSDPSIVNSIKESVTSIL